VRDENQNKICLLSKMHRVIFICALVTLTTGCASYDPIQQDSRVLTNSDQTTIRNGGESDLMGDGWWHIGFHREVMDEETIQWHYDAFIAHNIIKPLIHKYPQIKLWRFHRRAVQDNSGHKFSYIFYAPRALGEKFYQFVNQHPLANQLLADNHIDRISFYDINGEQRSNIENTSDKSWPIELQKTWPYFIMGVSQTWLGLVEYYYDRLEMSDDADLAEQLDGFKQVSANVNLVWERSGNHAFLHHLNALFAYQELYILEHRRGRF
jgi:hypothetical protein